MKTAPAPHAVAAHSTGPRPALSWPDDLRWVVAEDRLLAIVLETVASVDLPVPRAAGGHRKAEMPSGPAILSVLTYNYAVGRWGSDEIVEGARADRAVWYLCAGHLPAAPALRRFRRAHRSSLVQALHGVLWRVAADSGTAGEPAWTDSPPGLLNEARRRIEAAILADTIALDV